MEESLVKLNLVQFFTKRIIFESARIDEKGNLRVNL